MPYTGSFLEPIVTKTPLDGMRIHLYTTMQYATLQCITKQHETIKLQQGSRKHKKAHYNNIHYNATKHNKTHITVKCNDQMQWPQ